MALEINNKYSIMTLQKKIIDKFNLDSDVFIKNNQNLYSYTVGNKTVYLFTFNELNNFLKWFMKEYSYEFILELTNINLKVLFDYSVLVSAIDIDYKQFKKNIIGKNGSKFLIDLISNIGINKFIDDVLIERKQYRCIGIYKSNENMFKCNYSIY